MLQPIPWSTAVGHWLTLNWLSTTTWPIAIMICQSTDDRDVGRYVKIVCDLVYVTDQSGISALRMRWEKKNLYRWWRLSTICYTCDTLSVLDWWLTDTLLTHYQCYWHLINTLFDTICLDLCIVTNMYTDSWPRYWPVHQSTPPLWHMIGDVYVTGQKY